MLLIIMLLIIVGVIISAFASYAHYSVARDLLVILARDELLKKKVLLDNKKEMLLKKVAQKLQSEISIWLPLAIISIVGTISFIISSTYAIGGTLQDSLMFIACAGSTTSLFQLYIKAQTDISWIDKLTTDILVIRINMAIDALHIHKLSQQDILSKFDETSASNEWEMMFDITWEAFKDQTTMNKQEFGLCVKKGAIANLEDELAATDKMIGELNVELTRLVAAKRRQ